MIVRGRGEARAPPASPHPNEAAAHPLAPWAMFHKNGEGGVRRGPRGPTAEVLNAEISVFKRKMTERRRRRRRRREDGEGVGPGCWCERDEGRKEGRGERKYRFTARKGEAGLKQEGVLSYPAWTAIRSEEGGHGPSLLPRSADPCLFFFSPVYPPVRRRRREEEEGGGHARGEDAVISQGCSDEEGGEREREREWEREREREI